MMKLLQEGKVKFYASEGKISRDLEVFYNPGMKYNRDVSIDLINSIPDKDLHITEVMAGSGIRILRFIKELKKGKIKTISANDYNENFPKLMKDNLELNDISQEVRISNTEANLFMLRSNGFDYIDIDPFGSPGPFLESAIKRLSRNGILAITATDTAPLCGTYPDACKRAYWSKPLKNHMMHETGLRILIRKVQLIGAKYDRALTPMLAYYRDYYFRIFFRCTKGKKACNEILKHHKYIMFCNRCFNYWIDDMPSKHCNDCDYDEFEKKTNSDTNYAGPLWAGSLKSIKVSSEDKFTKSLMDELDIPGFHDIHELSSKMHIHTPKMDDLVNEIKKTHKASRTHFTDYGIKTDMSIKELKEKLKKL